MKRFIRPSGMTLLEILIALSLMVVLLGFVWGMVTLFSADYIAGEKRISRAQLVRSVSQMLSDDLGAAVQDPIHPTPDSDSGLYYVRRFGLHGDATSLQIDVVQPNLLVETAGLDENRAAAASSSKPARPQVPELKTVFYEFVPPNALAPSAADRSGAAVPRTAVRKYGLSRKELSYEAPDPDNPISDEGQNDSSFSFEPAAGSPEKETSFSPAEPQPFLTAPQLAMLIDDSTVWMPEVVDFRLRYYDGKKWFSSWDSIKRNGLPTAIEADIKLMPLDDVEELRASPLLSRLVYPPNRFNDVSGQSAPGGKYTLEAVAETLNLSPVMTRRVIARVPITPLSEHHSPARRKPLPAVKGEVGAQTGIGAGSRAVGEGDWIGGRNVVGSGDLFPAAGPAPGDGESFGGLLAPGQTASPSPFGRVDSLLSGFDAPADTGFEGMVSAPAGISAPTETAAPAPQTGVRQQWLRGKR